MLAALSFVGYREPKGFAGFRPETGARGMGLDYYVHVFNVKSYREKVLPAYQAFFHKDDPAPLLALLKEIIERLDRDMKLPGPALESKAAYQEYVELLNRTAHYDPGEDHAVSLGVTEKRLTPKQILVRDNLGSSILFALCVPRDKGVNPEQNMGRSPLIPYLYKRSERIEDLFTNGDVQGGELEIAIGDSHPQLFTKNDLQKLSAELERVSAPENPELRKEFDNLRAILKLALGDPDLTLLLSLL